MRAEEAIEEVMTRPRSSFVPFPGMHCIRRSDWHQLTTPAICEGGFNEVSLAILGEEEADKIIDETIGAYKNLGLRFRWTVGPASRPLDLGARLVARGLTPVPVAGMMVKTELCSNSAGPSAGVMARGTELRPGVEVLRVSADSIDDFNDVMMRGWGVQSAVLCEYNCHVLSTAPETNPFFLATVDGEPVGGASYFRFAKSVFLVGAVVLPEYRKQGIYRALVRARLQHAHAAGIQWATTHAMVESSAPLLEAFGFETVCLFQSYLSR